MPLGLLKLWQHNPVLMPLSIDLYSSYFIADGERDVVRDLSRDVLTFDKIREAVRKYESAGIAFHKYYTCYYTSIDSEKSVDLCRKLSEEVRLDYVHFAACRRDNCIVMIAEFGSATVDLMVLGEDNRTKIITYMPSVVKLLRTLYGDKVQVEERYPHYQVLIEDKFENVVKKLVDFIKLFARAEENPRELEDKLFELKREEIYRRIREVLGIQV